MPLMTFDRASAFRAVLAKRPGAYLGKTLLAASIALALSGCATSGDDPRIVLPFHDSAKSSISEAEALFLERQVTPDRSLSSVQRVHDVYVDVRPRERDNGQWLKSIPFSMTVSEAENGPISLMQIMKMFSRQGLNITSDIPLNSHYYAGLSIHDSNAQDALRMILGSMGVDYEVDDSSRMVRITHLPRRSYTLTLNNRISNYDSGKLGKLDEEAAAGEEAEADEMGIQATNNFWESLEEEILARCTILAPGEGEAVGSAANRYSSNDPDQLLAQTLQNDAARIVQGSLEETSACRHTVNPNTGTVTVQAPRWIQDELGEYFERLNKMLNTRITLQAKIVLFRSTEDKTEGLDLSLFAGELAKTGLAVQNNVLGGLTLEDAGRNRTDITAAGAIANSFVGGRIDGAQLFLGWLESQGSVSIENEPVITTVSGVPTTFKRTSPVVYFRYSQETTATEGGAVLVSIESKEIERRIGSIINVNPSYDIDRRLVRTQLGITQRYLTGWQEDTSYLAAGSNIQAIPVRVPLIENILLSGELLLRDGETIIVGGQKFTTASQDESGVTQLRQQKALGGIFGQSAASNQAVTYYVILSVSVDESPNDLPSRL
ncbi:hypothetical protein VRRI112168_00230 [Vreelandella rituensis]|uniref:Type II/III secretion system secretin-like domain-containing protein n=1 Tax=Vreelandella rituensis TaxID=2282306 RepID=A0A368UA32_9GAMM|nr:hypothetical protein [Halomonas rituensis]RCV93875.1 hypothetical protein DU506_01575 [Halomonas rituensis]